MTTRDDVRRAYAAAAGSDVDPLTGRCAGSSGPASLGCANPLSVLDLAPGETVLDLGSGAGLDAIASARRVGPAGMVYGLDMTPEMIQAARENQRSAGIDNVRFLEGYVEDVPLGDESVDAVISNCVVNLTDDKRAVFGEIHRVLRPGGRAGIADLVVAPGSTARPPEGVRPLTREQYVDLLGDAGFVDIGVALLPEERSDGLAAAVVRATKPARA